MSTEISSPRRLWRSASVTAPRATWATCAPPPTTMMRLPKTRSRARVRWTIRMSSRPSRAATRSASDTPSTSSSISTIGGSPSSRRTVVKARIRPLMPATRSATAVIASGRSTTSKPERRSLGGATLGHQPSEPRPAAPGRRSMVGWSRAVGGGRIVLLERESQARERLAGQRGVRGREHERAVRVLGHTDDAGDVHATFGEGRRDAGERARLIVELDCEPDRHADTSCAHDGSGGGDLSGPRGCRARSACCAWRRRAVHGSGGLCLAPRAVHGMTVSTNDTCPGDRNVHQTHRTATQEVHRVDQGHRVHRSAKNPRFPVRYGHQVHTPPFRTC